MINLLNLEAGMRLELLDGTIVEVIENMGDGQWVLAKRIGPSNARDAGSEQLCHAQDIVGLAPHE